MANSNFIKFREEYPKFIYENYNIEENENEIVLSFEFEIEKLSKFNPKLIIPKKNIIKLNSKLDLTSNMFKNLVFNLGMVELISYYKLTCSPKIIVKCGFLSVKQIAWFKKLIYNGLGEFMYVNDIDITIDELVNISSSKNMKLSINENTNKLKGQLIPIGGGKDSCVSLEVLESLRKINTPFIINERQATINTVKKADYLDNYISINRILDKNMLDLNKKGFLNGHTPFSAMVAFTSLIIAYLTNKKYIILSNESSANEPSVIGTDINHQYSKSFEFENDFRNYEKEFLKTNIEYFSLLRPLTELQIAMLFSSYKKYHEIFRSCNKGSKEDIWCTDCSKCLFVYIILSPFLEDNELIKIFGENLFEKDALYYTLMQLIGKEETKPFDCVGTYEEVNYCLCKKISILNELDEKLPILLENYVTDILGGNIQKAKGIVEIYEDELLNNFEANNLNEEFQKLLKKALKGVKNGRINK